MIILSSIREDCTPLSVMYPSKSVSLLLNNQLNQQPLLQPLDRKWITFIPPLFQPRCLCNTCFHVLLLIRSFHPLCFVSRWSSCEYSNYADVCLTFERAGEDTVIYLLLWHPESVNQQSTPTPPPPLRHNTTGTSYSKHNQCKVEKEAWRVSVLRKKKAFIKRGLNTNHTKWHTKKWKRC